MHFRIVAKFSRWKSSSISPYFRGGNSTVFHLRCVIAHKTLFSPNFHSENTTIKVPHFHGENSEEFHIWCAMAHQQGFMPMYTTHFSMFILRRAKAHQNIIHADACHIHGETNVTSWHGSKQSHHNDDAHNVAWICTYSIRLKHIPILQGQKHPQSRVGHSPNHESPSHKVHDHAQASRYVTPRTASTCPLTEFLGLYLMSNDPSLVPYFAILPIKSDLFSKDYSGYFISTYTVCAWK